MMWTQYEIEDMILGMADIVKENRALRKRVNDLEVEVAINDAQRRMHHSLKAEKEYKILRDIQLHNLSCSMAESNGWLTNQEYIDDWSRELRARMATEKEIKPL